MNEWGFRPHLRTIGQIGPGKPPEDGEMNKMTLPSRHRIRNSVWGRAGYLSVIEAPHKTESLQVSGYMFLWNLNTRAGTNPRSPTFQTGSFTHCTRAPIPITPITGIKDDAEFPPNDPSSKALHVHCHRKKNWKQNISRTAEPLSDAKNEHTRRRFSTLFVCEIPNTASNAQLGVRAGALG